MASSSARTISSLYQLNPGDHIHVEGNFFSAGTPLFYHHMLVVKVVSESQIQVIHKIFKVVEEVLFLRPEDITVLDYECHYTEQRAVWRAQRRIGEVEFSLLWSNCEHFVTEVRTGTAQSIQVQDFICGIALIIALAVVALYSCYMQVIQTMIEKEHLVHTPTRISIIIPQHCYWLIYCTLS